MDIKQILKAILTLSVVIWALGGSLHLLEHGSDHRSDCEICFQIDHQNADISAPEISFREHNFEEPLIKQGQSLVSIFSESEFFFRRGPPQI